MALIVADTDVLIDFLSGKGPGAGPVASESSRGLLAVTAVSRFELLAGARTAHQEDVVRQLLAGLLTLPLDAAAADRAAAVRRALERTGLGIGMADSLIAGIVIEHQGHLLTRNLDHFSRVQGLDLADVPDGGQ